MPPSFTLATAPPAVPDTVWIRNVLSSSPRRALVERKGHHRIVEILPQLSPQLSPARAPQLLIAGGPGPEGQYETELRRQIARLGLEPAVRLLGPVPPGTLAELMSLADVLCLASTNEGWPNVVHEALACGTPVVATDVGAIPEMLDHGRFGLIVPLHDSSQLRHALEEALRRDWDRLAIAQWGRERTWDQVAAEVLVEMRKIVAETAVQPGVRDA